MDITPHQKEKGQLVLEAIKSGLNRVVLTGSAGVGKTFLINWILKQFYTGRGIMYVTAPTHKALAVLKGKIDDNPFYNIEFSTIHSALKLKRKFSSNGAVYFKQEYPKMFPPFPNCRLLVIDEASMLNSEMLDHLKQYSFPIIFIGDEKQINPVKEDESPVFHQHWTTIELTEIIRQGEGNPIIELSRNIPLIWTKKPHLIENRQGYLYTVDRPKVIAKLAEVNGTDALKYLAWTNDEVDAINSSVRHLIYGANPAMIEQGETLVLNAPYSTNSGEDDYYTNQEILIESVNVIEKKIYPPGLDPVKMKMYHINENMYAIHEESLLDYKYIAKGVKFKASAQDIKWVEYYKFIEGFADFKYNHAITVHKSQGSTYLDTIVNVGNLRRNRNTKEKQRLLYTAVTRASKLLILYNV